MKVHVGIINDLSNLKFVGESGTTVLEHTIQFLEFFTKHNIHYEDISCRLFFLTFKAHIKEWCYTLRTSSIDYFKYLFKNLYHEFDIYDYKFIYKKITHLRKEANESLNNFNDHFIHFIP